MTADTHSSIESFVTKLERRTPLPADARAAFLAVPLTVVQADAQDVVIEENAPSRNSFFVASGFLSRQKRANHGRQIMAFAIAGDAVDMQSLWFHRQDHSLVAHKKTVLLAVAHAQIVELCEAWPVLAKALWHDSLVDAAIFREWTLNVGHRRARQRLAHLYLELAARLKAHGLIHDDVFELPVTQSELASALGLSLVHLNKSLKALRDQGLVKSEGKIVTLLDRDGLQKMTQFDPGYLHIETALQFHVETVQA